MELHAASLQEFVDACRGHRLPRACCAKMTPVAGQCVATPTDVILGLVPRTLVPQVLKKMLAETSPRLVAG